MRIEPLLASAIVATLVFAGCTSSDASTKAPASSSAAPAAPPTVTADTGSISGVVITQELAPIEGADVAKLENSKDMATKTDKEGRFTFNDVAPGEYRLVAQKLGFESRAVAVMVEVGKVAETKFILTAVAINEAHPETFQYDGFFSCGASSPVLTIACRGLVDANDRSSFRTNVTRSDIMTVVDAMTWDATAPATAKILRNVFSVVGVSGSGAEKNSVSPNVLRIDEPKAKKGAQLNHLIWIGWTSASDPTQVVVVVYQQKYHLTTTVFYGEEAPEDFTGLPP